MIELGQTMLNAELGAGEIKGMGPERHCRSASNR
jgi:hypothetical protein